YRRLSRADGESCAMTWPKQTPRAPSPANPSARTEKSAEFGKNSTEIGARGVNLYFEESLVFASSSSSAAYGARTSLSFGSALMMKSPCFVSRYSFIESNKSSVFLAQALK